MTQSSANLEQSTESTDKDQRIAKKALRINLDPTTYGTFAEIGGGQEVSRWFFRVGGAAGTVANSISAYDMLCSDAIYGKGTRYVSSQRLTAMLDHEYKLLNERLKETRGEKSRFFVFADTVSARNYAGTNECHGWIGLRFQAQPLATPNDILIHINMRDSTNLLQQKALGALGVNLIHAAMYDRNSTEEMIKSLFDALSLNRIELDYIRMTGPEFKEINQATLSMLLIRNNLCHATAFDASNTPVTPSELLHSKPIVLQRGALSIDKSKQVMRDSEAALVKELQNTDRAPLGLFEISLNSAQTADGPSNADLLARVESLTKLGYAVLLSNFEGHFRLSEYFRRYTEQPIRVALSAGNLAEALKHNYYSALQGGLLEGLGKLLAQGIKAYVFPMTREEFLRCESIKEFCSASGEDLVTAQNISFQGPVRHLYTYLLDSNSIIPMNT